MESNYMETRTIIAIAIIWIIVSIIAIFASYFSGVKAGKVNEKRKEWNAIVEPILVKLELIQDIWETNDSLHIDPLPYKNIEMLYRRTTDKENKKLILAWNKYYQCRDMIKQCKQNEDINTIYRDGVESVKELRKILSIK